MKPTDPIAMTNLPGTEPLQAQGDLAAQMVAGIDRYFVGQLEAAVKERAQHWQHNDSSPQAYEQSIEPNRQRLRGLLGLADSRVPSDLKLNAPPPPMRPEIGEGRGYHIYAVQWHVLDGVTAEGLLLQPDGAPVADIIALPDCDQTPEMIAGLSPGIPQSAWFALRLAENGCRVLAPLLIDRRDTYSGIPGVGMTNLPHREFLYRAAYEMGRTMIGYEVQKVLAAVDWLELAGKRPRGIIGYGEGGLIAFYAAALDPRLDAVVVSGYFQPREALWSEPIYRNVFGLLNEFGDAEIASLIVPRRLIVETSHHPPVTGPPQTPGRSGGAPGQIVTPPLQAVESEFERVKALSGRLADSLSLVNSQDGLPGGDQALSELFAALGLSQSLQALTGPPRQIADLPDCDIRMERQFREIASHIQQLVTVAPQRRAEFWTNADASTVEKWQQTTTAYRELFWDKVIGRLPPPTILPSPRTRLVYETPSFLGYDVMLDVYPEVFAYGILLVPRDVKEGERRPVVMCQHGLEGRPQILADPAIDSPHYHHVACRLAAEGFVTYAPQNPYIGGDDFRVLLRKAQPLGKTLFSVIVRQHQQTLDWLAGLPFVDPARIAFYGLSYGGKTAMRVPAVLDRYCLSICSADYNEWIWKNTSMLSPYSYLLTREYDMPEWNLGNTFNYAEMSWLISPRPFMVERGHHDGVASDEWVAYEYARTRRHYDLLGIGDRTEMEVFNGPHTIHGVGTFEFLRKHLSHKSR